MLIPVRPTRTHHPAGEAVVREIDHESDGNNDGGSDGGSVNLSRRALALGTGVGSYDGNGDGGADGGSVGANDGKGVVDAALRADQMSSNSCRDAAARRMSASTERRGQPRTVPGLFGLGFEVEGGDAGEVK